ncbi:MAG TPA: penicillin acylase family protein [Thermoanaerobaculia bacterium]|nr:penicillin acylase family protein [Thermoanaerobaculia bacterium]
MKKLLLVLLALSLPFAGQASPATAARHARNVEIVRDDWGIAHVHGKTDADAVFGMIYAQAEDDFNRVETNYLLSMGRLAEAEGEGQIYRDLRMRLFIDPADLKAMYGQSPAWLKALMDAWADGLNFYLAKHPEVKPRVITHFEPWMALSFTEGSIGGDIERVDLHELRAFYEATPTTPIAELRRSHEPTGSNGIAIAPANSKSHHALLLINPHTSFFFRSELQMSSDEGLDAYGAVTWGQIFIYQGFNRHIGWMHTSSGVDNIDEYAETITKKDGKYFQRYGDKELPVASRTVVIPYKTANGMAKKVFTVYRTQHGPVERKADGKWITIRLMGDPIHALEQSYGRTKATSLEGFLKWMELHTNSSNNTVFADSHGDIAYFHSNFIPRRDARFDWLEPVDGSNPATDWHGVLSINQTPNVINPPDGWLYNSNNWPWSAAGPDSPKRADYPVYVERGREETPRGLHALELLPRAKEMTVASLIALAFDRHMTAFDSFMPPLLKDYEALPESDARKAQLAEQIDVLRKWDHRWAVDSIPTSLAIFWAEDLGRRVAPEAHAAGMIPDDYAATKATADERLASLTAASEKLASDFGSWQTPWGTINRFQRINDDIEPHFDDAKPSIPVGFVSSRWGSLASFGARAYRNTKRWYGTSGNSFVAVIEFGPHVQARAVTAGGESGDPSSPHFNDEAERYATGNLREVYFYPDQLEGHIERRYHP